MTTRAMHPTPNFPGFDHVAGTEVETCADCRYRLVERICDTCGVSDSAYEAWGEFVCEDCNAHLELIDAAVRPA